MRVSVAADDGVEIGPLLIRADASAVVGTGHAMRCLALAQAWMEVCGEAAFIIGSDMLALRQRLAVEGCSVRDCSFTPGSVEDADHLIQSAQRRTANWVVLDGYCFGADYQSRLAEAGLKLVVVDDNAHADHYHADFIVNQNLHARESMYAARQQHTEVLLGSKYALLRNEFRCAVNTHRSIPNIASRLLVTLGGTDIDNVTMKVIQAINEIMKSQAVDGLETMIVVGPGNPHVGELECVLRESGTNIRLRRDVRNMAELMSWADVAIGAAGTTSWERAAFGLPTITIVVADNQREVAASLQEAGCTINLGWFADCSPEAIAKATVALAHDKPKRDEMARHGRKLVDTYGAMRVVNRLLGKPLMLRPARFDDSQIIWSWSNESEVRRLAFSSQPIPWEEHSKWFQQKLCDPACHFFVAENRDRVPVGQFRADIRDGEAVITINLERQSRGGGLGTELIREGIDKLMRVSAVETAVALIKTENKRSQSAFLKAGFERDGMQHIGNDVAERFVARRRQSEPAESQLESVAVHQAQDQ